MTATRTAAAINRLVRVLLVVLAARALLALPMSIVAAASPSGEQTAAMASAPAGATPNAQTPGTIQGTLVNGTAGASIPSGLVVTLHGYDDFAASVTMTATADAAGAFTFQNLPEVSGRYYMLSVPYEGVPYSSDLLKFDANTPTLKAKVQLYDATSDRSGLRLTQMHLVFDLAGDTATVTEICLFSNSSGRTFVAPGGAGLTIPVPTGAAAVTVQNQRGSISATRTVRGLQITTPLQPGPSTAELVFTFRLLSHPPAFEQTLPLPVDGLTVFVADNGPAIQGAGLQDGGQQNFQGKLYHSFTAGKFAAGDKIAFQFAGAASSFPWPAGPNMQLIFGLGLINLLLLFGIGLMLWRRRAFPRLPLFRSRRRGRAPDDLDAPPVAE